MLVFSLHVQSATRMYLVGKGPQIFNDVWLLFFRAFLLPGQQGHGMSMKGLEEAQISLLIIQRPLGNFLNHRLSKESLY